MARNVNESKANSSAQWAKWKASGAVAGMPEAVMNKTLENPVTVDATGTFKKDGQVMQTLTLDMHVVAEGEGYTVSRPSCAVVVPGDNFRPGDVVDRSSFPKKAKPVERVFGE